MTNYSTQPSINSEQAVSYAVWASLKAAIVSLKYEEQRVVIVSDVAISEAIDTMVPGYCLSGLADAAIPFATGVATANPALKIVVVCQASRLNPAIVEQAALDNHNVTLVVVNDLQDANLASSYVATVIAQPAGWIARGITSQPEALRSMLVSAAKFDGLAVLEVLQPNHDASRLSFAYIHAHSAALTTPFADVTQLWPALYSVDPVYLGQFWRHPAPSFQTKLLKQFEVPLVDKPLSSTNLKSFLTKYK